MWLQDQHRSGGDGGAGGGNLCGLGSRNRGLQWGSKGGKGLVKQVRDFRPFIQRTVESHGDILSRGLATSELRLRQVSEACNRENGFEDRRPGGWALTHPGRRLWWTRQAIKESGLWGFGGCLGVGAEEGCIGDDS